jgi:1-acyl-sn-glycerol-3-phosphate acyltransferase
MPPSEIQNMIENIKKLWFRALYRILSGFAFNRIVVTGSISQWRGATLYVGLHRNGAIDGAVYQRAAPRAKMTLSSQLRRKAWMRAIFDGIEIVRPQDAAQDGARVSNADSFAQASRYLVEGGELVFFPEGTSELGPRHLRFRTGVARLVQQALEHLPELKVVPLAAHYEDATAWQSNVDIRVGQALYLRGALSTAEIMTALSSALEEVGLDCDTLEERQTVESLAYAATLGNQDIPYSKALKALAHNPFGERLKALCVTGRQFFHQGVPLAPVGTVWPYYAALMVLLPLQILMGALNVAPYLAMEALVERLSDGPNVRSLWRALTGIMLLAIWGGLIVSPLLVFVDWRLVPLYWLGCVLQVKTLYRTKKLLITVANHLVGFSTSRLGDRRALMHLHQELTTYVRNKL